MMNSSQKNQNNFKQHPNANSYITTSIDEIGQMLSNQRLMDHRDQASMNLSKTPISYMNANHQFSNSIVSNQRETNNSTIRCLNPNLTKPMNQLIDKSINKLPKAVNVNQTIINTPLPIISVPDVNKYLNKNYENLNAVTYANQPISQSINNQKKIDQKILNRDLISPNITGLPEVTRKKASPSCQDIYANTSIVSRYVPSPDNYPKYSSNQTDKFTKYSSNMMNKLKDNEINGRYDSLVNNEISSLYDPVYFRTNSQLSFESTKDDSIISTHTSPITSPSFLPAAAGNRQPINAFMNNELDQVYNKSIIKPENENKIVIHHPSKEREVDYLTKLLVKGLQNSTDPEFFGMCYKCGKTILGEGCTALNQLYHIECFTCNVCDRPLRGVAFYLMEEKPYCEEDYLNTLDRCCICNKPILDRVLRAMGNCYHPQCLCCVVCGICLDGIHFTVDHKNSLFCIKDFHEKYAPRCDVCSKPIVPENGQMEAVRIVTLDRIFHVKCYKCEDCGVLLSSEKDNGKGCYPLDNALLCKECNNTRFHKYLLTN